MINIWWALATVILTNVCLLLGLYLGTRGRGDIIDDEDFEQPKGQQKEPRRREPTENEKYMSSLLSNGKDRTNQ